MGSTGALSATQLSSLCSVLRLQNGRGRGIMEYSALSAVLRRLSSDSCSFAQSEPVLPAMWRDRALSEAQLSALMETCVLPYESRLLVNWKLFVLSLMLQTVTLWMDATPSNVWHRLLFDIFTVDTDSENAETETETEENPEPMMSYGELLYHACFNDDSHCGAEKVTALAQNVTVVSDATRISDSDLEAMQLRGISGVEIGNNIATIYHEELDLAELKRNRQVMTSFNFLHVQRALQTRD